MQEFFNKAVDLCTQAGGKVILALVVFIVGRIIIGKIMKLISKGKMISKVDPTAASFFKNAVKIGLYVILVVSIIGILGVPMASVVAVIASCGVAVGLALQGALSNLAGGIMLLIFRPFAVGDYIVGAGTEGNVKEIETCGSYVPCCRQCSDQRSRGSADQRYGRKREGPYRSGTVRCSARAGLRRSQICDPRMVQNIGLLGCLFRTDERYPDSPR